MAAPILQVKDLKTQFFTDDGVVKAVNGVSFDLYPGETLGIVGESGCGKSVTALSILRLVQEPGRIVNGQILFKGDNIVTMSDEEVREIRGKDIAMIFQDPLSSLNPVLTVGFQIEEAIEAHGKVPGKTALSRTVALLKQVRIPAAESRVHDYPHQFSGGMRQRAMIDGPRQLALDLDCRRTDHRAGCHGAGADPRATARPQPRPEDGHHLDHPQH